MELFAKVIDRTWVTADSVTALGYPLAIGKSQCKHV